MGGGCIKPGALHQQLAGDPVAHLLFLAETFKVAPKVKGILNM